MFAPAPSDHPAVGRFAEVAVCGNDKGSPVVLTVSRCAPAAAAVVATAALVGCSGGPPPEGPLMKPNRHAWAMSVEPGQAFTDGVETLELPGSVDGVLHSVELVGDEAIDLVGVKLVKPGRKWASIQSAGWPIHDPDIKPHEVVPAEGATFTPRGKDPQGWELLIGLKVDEPGYFVRKGVVVHYSVGGEDYRQFYPAVLAICTDGTPRKKCPTPKGWGRFPTSLP
jgi:hypothetical protein